MGSARLARKSETAVMLEAVKEEVRWALWVLTRLPGIQFPKAPGSQLGAIAAVPSERPLKVLPSAADITHAHGLYQILLDALPDEFERRLVLGRGLKQPWSLLSTYDPARRQMRQIKNLHDQALATLYFSGFLAVRRK